MPVSTTWICIRYVLDSNVNAHVEFKDEIFYLDTYIFLVIDSQVLSDFEGSYFRHL